MEPIKRASQVSATTKQEAESHDLEGGNNPAEWTWVEGCVWTAPMLAALGNGVKGGKWFSLMDKVYAKKTLA